MYHYVRPGARALPHYPHLDLEDFERQLDSLTETRGLVGREAFERWVEGGPTPTGFLLTFDDGLRDHVDYVLPVLRRRGAFGLFYVPSAPVTDGVILDVHKIHLVLGRVGGPAALDRLTERHPRVSAADTGAGHYAGQVSDPATKRVKHLLNWRLDPEERRELIDDLVDFAFDGRPPRAADVYVDEQGIRRLAAAGMGVGAHGHEHVVLRGLKRARQELEIRRACDVIRSLAGTLCWGYCYAYGAFDATSESLVASAGFPFAFAASAGDIGTRFTETPRFALPRRNCNSFPHGIASVGGRRLSS